MGQYVLWPTFLQLGEEKVFGAQSIDTYVHADFRGLGLFRELAGVCTKMATQRGMDVFYGFPNARSYPGFIKLLNWDYVGDIRMWVRPIKPSLNERMPEVIGPLAGLGAMFFPSGSARHDVTISASSHIPLNGRAVQGLVFWSILVATIWYGLF